MSSIQASRAVLHTAACRITQSDRLLLRGVVLTVFLLAGCQQLPALPTLTPYKMDIQQGNVVTQEMLSKLKPGMTPGQVRFILGTPLVVDAFHKDRWDYVYRFVKAGRLQEHRRIVVVFQDDKLARIEGDVVSAPLAGTTDGGVKIDKPALQPDPPASATPSPPQSAPEGIAAPLTESSATATAGEPVTSGASGSDAIGAGPKPKDEDKAKKQEPKTERGFFGRMLDKLGF